jgi:hypothetical protein
MRRNNRENHSDNWEWNFAIPIIVRATLKTLAVVMSFERVCLRKTLNTRRERVRVASMTLTTIRASLTFSRIVVGQSKPLALGTRHGHVVCRRTL